MSARRPLSPRPETAPRAPVATAPGPTPLPLQGPALEAFLDAMAELLLRSLRR